MASAPSIEIKLTDKIELTELEASLFVLGFFRAYLSFGPDEFVRSLSFKDESIKLASGPGREGILKFVDTIKCQPLLLFAAKPDEFALLLSRIEGAIPSASVSIFSRMYNAFKPIKNKPSFRNEIVAALKSSDDLLRMHAAELLAYAVPLNSDESTALHHCLADTHRTVRVAAAETLFLNGERDHAYIDTCLEALTFPGFGMPHVEGAELVRARAAQSFAIFGDSSPRILEALNNARYDVYSNVRIAANSTLAQLNIFPCDALKRLKVEHVGTAFINVQNGRGSIAFYRSGGEPFLVDVLTLTETTAAASASVVTPVAHTIATPVASHTAAPSSIITDSSVRAAGAAAGAVVGTFLATFIPAALNALFSTPGSHSGPR
jgi:hypothetical protein